MASDLPTHEAAAQDGPTKDQCYHLTDEQCRKIQELLDPDGKRRNQNWGLAYQPTMICCYMAGSGFVKISKAVPTPGGPKTFYDRFKDWFFPVEPVQRLKTTKYLYAMVAPTTALPPSTRTKSASINSTAALPPSAPKKSIFIDLTGTSLPPTQKKTCKTCGTAFNRDEHLQRHMHTHTRVRPFKCQRCSRSFARKDTLSRHQVVHRDSYPSKLLAKPRIVLVSPESTKLAAPSISDFAPTKAQCSFLTDEQCRTMPELLDLERKGCNQDWELASPINPTATLPPAVRTNSTSINPPAAQAPAARTKSASSPSVLSARTKSASINPAATLPPLIQTPLFQLLPRLPQPEQSRLPPMQSPSQHKENRLPSIQSLPSPQEENRLPPIQSPFQHEEIRLSPIQPLLCLSKNKLASVNPIAALPQHEQVGFGQSNRCSASARPKSALIDLTGTSPPQHTQSCFIDAKNTRLEDGRSNISLSPRTREGNGHFDQLDY